MLAIKHASTGTYGYERTLRQHDLRICGCEQSE